MAALACACATLAGASTTLTDASDLWWNPAESGWGVNIAHQADTLFATIFVYAPSGEAKWYVASDMARTAGTSIFTGPLYETRGPTFTGNFNPLAVSARPVGTATFTLQGVNDAGFAYSVDGIAVSKTITRQTFRRNDLTGQYLGAFIGTYSGCSTDGYREEIVDLTVEHSASEISIETRFGIENCTFAGTYSQAGRMGSINGTVDCGNGPIGPFVGLEIEGTRSAIGGRATAMYGNCRWSGRFAAARLGAEP